jgi:hypothetical protein
MMRKLRRSLHPRSRDFTSRQASTLVSRGARAAGFRTTLALYSKAKARAKARNVVCWTCSRVDGAAKVSIR